MAAQLEQVRDLEADLAICEAASHSHVRFTKFVVEARVGWPHAIRRAIAAEERADKLQEEIRLLHDAMHGRGIPWD